MKTDSAFRQSSGLRRAAWIGVVCALIALAPIRTPQKDVVLVGPLPKEKILEALPEWARLAKAYEPNIRAVDAIHYFSKPARIRVFFASWNPDGKALTAAFLRTMEMADNSAVAVEWIGVSKDMKEPSEALRSGAVDKVPTLIVFVEGVEKGRVIGAPQFTIEEDVASLLLDMPVSASADDYDMEYFRRTPHSHLPIDCSPCHIPVRPRSLRHP
jgi:thiol-disulfide isomerase/thioredoxin